MKTKAVLAFIVMLILIVGAFAIGSYRVYLDERMQVELALGSLGDVLVSRIEMGHNLLTVARRHLKPDDPLLRAVIKDMDVLEEADTLHEIAQANEQLSKDSKALLDHLQSVASVIQDDRDYRYVTGLLPRGFEQSAQWADARQYNEAAAEFNKRLNTTLNGRVAKLLGVDEAERFGLEGAGR